MIKSGTKLLLTKLEITLTLILISLYASILKAYVTRILRIKFDLLEMYEKPEGNQPIKMTIQKSGEQVESNHNTHNSNGLLVLVVAAL